MFQAKQILVPVSLENQEEFEFSKGIVLSASDLAKQLKAELTILTITPITRFEDPEYDLGSDIYQSFKAVLNARNTETKKRLEELKKLSADLGVKTHSSYYETSESVPVAILEKAAQKKMDLIVVGSHARKGLKRLLLGSVAERVSHLARVPVLLLKN